MAIPFSALGLLEKCLPLFCSSSGADRCDDRTTSLSPRENWLYRKWYTLRFSMRHRYMKSLSLSKQLQVLTGRFFVVSRYRVCC